MSNKQKIVSPIPKGKKHDWIVKVNGNVIEEANFVQCSNPKFGDLEWGQRADGPDSIGPYWTEYQGGGVGIVLHTIIAGKLYIGLILQDRPSIHGDNWQIPRGFNISADSKESARTELAEETGLEYRAIFKLKGKGVNPNSTFFNTSDGKGFDFFALYIKPEMVIAGKTGLVKLSPGLFKPSKTSEKIKECEFFLWQNAVQVVDGFTGIGIARLLATKPELKKYL